MDSSDVTSHTNTQDLISLGEDEAASHGAFVDLERPIGQKAEKNKRKTKEKTNPDVDVILNEMKEEKMKKIKLFEEARDLDKEMFLFKQEEVRLKREEVRLKGEKVCLKQEEMRLRGEEVRLRERALRLDQVREERKLMMMDISGMDEMQQEYFCLRKKAILEGQNITLCSLF
ncbi:hypothetical protein SLA2020_416660 [Shorea laevis]